LRKVKWSLRRGVGGGSLGEDSDNEHFLIKRGKKKKMFPEKISVQ